MSESPQAGRAKFDPSKLVSSDSPDQRLDDLAAATGFVSQGASAPPVEPLDYSGYTPAPYTPPPAPVLDKVPGVVSPPPKNIARLRVLVAIICLVVVVVGFVGYHQTDSSGMAADQAQEMYQDYDGSEPDGWRQADASLSQGIVEVVDKASALGLATGIVVGEDGLVAVPLHAILHRGPLQLVDKATGGSAADFEVAGFSVADDLAVLRVTGWQPLIVATLGTGTSNTTPGVRLLSTASNGSLLEAPAHFGFGSGGESNRAEVLVGDIANDDVSYLGRVENPLAVSVDDEGPTEAVLLNQAGEVIGLSVWAMAHPSVDGSPASTTMYAVGAGAIQRVVDGVKAGLDTDDIHIGPPGDLGFQHMWVNATAMDTTLVTDVTPGGPADQVGIAVKDQILSINGVSTTAVQDAKIGPEGLICLLKPGTQVPITWLSDGGEKSAMITVGAATF